MAQEFKSYAPASAANLSVGFDLLGCALNPIDGAVLGDVITISKSEVPGCSVETIGKYQHKLPRDPKLNIVYDAYLLYKDELATMGKEPLDCKMVLSKNLPVCSGLGSSAASVVAAVNALDALNGNILGKEGCLRLMGILEGKISGSIHYDNVAPCFFGGLQLIVDDEKTVSKSLPFFEDWYFVSCFPGIKVSTNAARQILPKQYDRADVITFGKRLSNFVMACYEKDEELAFKCLVDVVAEPYREKLIPGLKEARVVARDLGAKATGISGSGSSIFSVFKNLEKAEQFKEYLERNFIANEDGFCHVCKIDGRGAYVEEV